VGLLGFRIPAVMQLEENAGDGVPEEGETQAAISAVAPGAAAEATAGG
jgi:hypothetical protein